MTSPPRPVSPRPVSGVIWAYRFNARGLASKVGRDEPLHPFPDDGGFLWLHLDLVDRLARDWIGGIDGLNAGAKAVLLSGDQQPSLDHDDFAVWGLFADRIRDPDDDTLQLGALRFGFGDGFIVSGRRRPIHCAAAIRDRIDDGRPVDSPAALFEMLVDHVLQAIAATLKKLRAETDSIEDRVLEERLSDEARSLGPLRRMAVRLRRQTAGFRTILAGLAADDDENSRPLARAAAMRLLRRAEGLDQEIQEVQERARLLQDEIAAKLANDTNRHLYVLSVVTALLLPPTLVTGFFGMNTGGLPFATGLHGWIAAMLIGVAASGFTYILLKRLGFFE